MPPTIFQLDVQKIEHLCLFELTWGQGQRLRATLAYPEALTQLYQAWQRAYLNFYKSPEFTAQPELRPSTPTSGPEGTAQSAGEDALRGWAIAAGTLKPMTVDWQAKLVEVEAQLLHQLHYWWRSAELFEIRAAIAQTHRAQAAGLHHPTHVYLTCTPLELARFPWEAWEIGADMAKVPGQCATSIRMVRCPATIRTAAEPGSNRASFRPQTRPRARILAVLGDDTGLNFQADRAAVQVLAKLAEVHFVGWQPGQTAEQVKQQIQAAIAAEPGWDLLFFAGHSNETHLTGGELGVAPGVSIAIQELAPTLAIAQRRGLQVAIFNSCSGLRMAEALIDLGFSQVAVMREPIHNRVAQEFLLRFLQSLAAQQDVQESLFAACQYLRMEKNLTYPSAYLVPSLFCHPGAPLFRITRWAWRQRLRQALPNRWAAIGLSACMVFSLVPGVQAQLLDQRLWLQALYRQVTHQLPPPAPAPIALVQIDEASVRRDVRIANPTPINRAYLADLIQQLTRQKAQIIGVDYVLDRPVGGEVLLRHALQTAIQTQHTWFVFGVPYNSLESEHLFAVQESGIAQPEWTMQGYVAVSPQHMTLPYPDENCQKTCPFGYLLALTDQAQQQLRPHLKPPRLDNPINLRTQSLATIQAQLAADTGPSPTSLQTLQRSQLSPLAAWFYETLGWIWLTPILDFSIPPDRVYQRIAAWRLMEKKPVQLPELPTQIVLIGAGEYTDPGGMVGDSLDLYPLPAALSYWQQQQSPRNAAASFPRSGSENTPAYLPKLTGAELHAYTIYHLLHHRLVLPIPDLWAVGLAAIAGQGLGLLCRRQAHQGRWTHRRRRNWLVGLSAASLGYVGMSFQSLITGSILLPLSLPIGVIWIYAATEFSRQVKN